MHGEWETVTEAEVDASPEQVWQAIATGHGPYCVVRRIVREVRSNLVGAGCCVDHKRCNRRAERDRVGAAATRRLPQQPGR